MAMELFGVILTWGALSDFFLTVLCLWFFFFCVCGLLRVLCLVFGCGLNEKNGVVFVLLVAMSATLGSILKSIISNY